MQADILGLPVVTAQTPEMSATGAAMLAGIGAGAFASFDEACQRVVVLGEELPPLAAHVRQYEAYYACYRSLYPALRPHFATLQALRGGESVSRPGA